MKLRISFAAVALLLLSMSANAKTFYVDDAVGSDTFDGSSAVVLTDTIGPFKTIDVALDSALDGDTIRVAEGIYIGNYIIDRQVTLLGPNQLQSGRFPRGPEAILVPDTAKRGVLPDNFNTLIEVLSDRVTIAGFLLLGDNDSFSSSNPQWGMDPDISYGIVAQGKISNLRIDNNRVEGFDEAGVLIDGANLQGSGVNKITDTYILGVGEIGLRGRGVWIRNSGHLVVENTKIDSAEYGIAIENLTDSLIRSIAILTSETYATYGIYVDGHVSTVPNANVLILANVIRGFSGNGTNGLTIMNSAAGAVVASQANNIQDFQNGIHVMDLGATTYSSTDDTISQVVYGINMRNTTNTMDTLFVDGSRITSATEDAILITADSSQSFLNATDPFVDGAKNGFTLVGDIYLQPGNSSLNNITEYYIRSRQNVQGTYPIIPVDGTNVLYDGSTGRDNSIADNMAVESKILHFMDSSHLHIVNIRPQNYYIDLTDGNDSLMRAFGFFKDQDTIHSAGASYNENLVLQYSNYLNSVNPDTVNLIEMNGSGKTFGILGTVSARNAVSLVDGVINTTGGRLYAGLEGVNEAGLGVTGGSASSYIEGQLYVVNNSGLNGDEVYFPIATSGQYRPIRMFMSHSTAGQLYTVRGEVINSAATGAINSPGITHTSFVRYWDLSVVNGSAPIDNIEYEALYASSPTDDEVSVPSALRLMVNSGSGWDDIGGTGSAIGDGTIRSDVAYASIANITLGNTKGAKNRLGRLGVIGDFSFANNCINEGVQFTSGSSTTNSAITGHEWDFGDQAITTDTSSQQNPLYVYNQPGTYTVTYVSTDDVGSTDTVTYSVTVDPQPEAGFATTIRCAPDNVDFIDSSKISGGSITTYEWSIDGSTVFTQNVSAPLADTGTYDIQLIVTSDQGCADTATQTIYYGPAVNISITPAGPINKCEEDTVRITVVTNALDYQWTDGDTNTVRRFVDPGVYVFEGTTGKDCYARDSVEIINVPAPIAEAGSDTTITRGSRIMLNGSGGGGYEWSPIETLDDPLIPNPTARPEQTTMYTLRVFNAIGCDAFDSVTVNVVWPDDISVPNLITPNNDGKNDVWNLSEVPDIENATVYVLSRWGKEVFFATNYQHNWEGFDENGELLPEGTYTYIIVFENSELGTLKGNLQIIR